MPAVGGAVTVCQQETLTLWCIWKGASWRPWLPIPYKNGRWLCSSLAIRTNHELCMWATASPPPAETSSLSRVSTHTFLLSPIKPTHNDTACDHMTCHLPIYTSVVAGSRCWLLRMSPIVPCGITLRSVIMMSAETHSVCSIQLGDRGKVLPWRRLICPLSHTLYTAS